MRWYKYLTFYHLNRLRGTKSIWAKYNALILGALFGLLSQNYYIALAVAVGYLAGESIGWGEWIGGLIRRIANIPIQDNPSRERMIYGIRKIALIFSKTDTDDYHATSLFIRGLYWWGLTFGALCWVLDPLLVIVVVLYLASWFPLSIIMAESNDKHWKNAEHIYGGAQDVGIWILIASSITNLLI